MVFSLSKSKVATVLQFPQNLKVLGLQRKSQKRYVQFAKGLYTDITPNALDKLKNWCLQTKEKPAQKSRLSDT